MPLLPYCGLRQPAVRLWLLWALMLRSGLARRVVLGCGVCLVPVAANRELREGVSQRCEGGARFATVAYHTGVAALEYKRWVQPAMKAHGRDSTDYRECKAAFNARCAERLLTVCHNHGGLYTKLGQHIASLNHVLPRVYVDKLSSLQDRAKGVPFPTVKDAVESELGGTLNSLFREFDEEPVGVASLAQVHRATTADGEEVAVKVQYPHLAQQVASDLEALALLLRAVAFAFPEFEFQWLLPEFRRAMQMEMDFRQEGRNAERTAAMFRGRQDVHVPAVHWGRCSGRVLTMEFVVGTAVTDTEALQKMGVRPGDVAGTLADVFSEMLFLRGWLHADPHPGNLMVRLRPEAGLAGGAFGGRLHQLVLLDHGLYRRLPDPFRQQYCRLWLGILLRDQEAVRRSGLQLGFPAAHAEQLPVLLAQMRGGTRAALGAGMGKAERAAARAERRAQGAAQVRAPPLPSEHAQTVRRTQRTQHRATHHTLTDEGGAVGGGAGGGAALAAVRAARRQLPARRGAGARRLGQGKAGAVRGARAAGGAAPDRG